MNTVIESPTCRYAANRLTPEEIAFLKRVSIPMQIDGKERFVLPTIFSTLGSIDEPTDWWAAAPLKNFSEAAQQQVLDVIKKYNF
jgi:DNA-binding FadR family transcriptional regulator